MLVTNSIKMDLNNHKNQYIVGLALTALGNICSAGRQAEWTFRVLCIVEWACGSSGLLRDMMLCVVLKAAGITALTNGCGFRDNPSTMWRHFTCCLVMDHGHVC